MDFAHNLPLQRKIVGGLIIAVLALAVWAVIDYNSPQSRYDRCQDKAAEIAANLHVPIALVLMSSDHGCGDPP
jgi:hypothetical protein